jgi:hypothetical protein
MKDDGKPDHLAAICSRKCEEGKFRFGVYHWRHHCRLLVEENVAYHLTHNTGESQNKFIKRCKHQDLNTCG